MKGVVLSVLIVFIVLSSLNFISGDGWAQCDGSKTMARYVTLDNCASCADVGLNAKNPRYITFDGTRGWWYCDDHVECPDTKNKACLAPSTGGTSPVSTPVNCVVGDWGECYYDSISETFIRTRSIVTPASNGGACQGTLREECPPEIKEVYWSSLGNSEDNRISSADRGDTVKMNAMAAGLGSEIMEFVRQKKDFIAWDSYGEILTDAYVLIATNGIEYFDALTGFDEGGDFRFISRVQNNENIKKESGVLKINSEIDNSMPSAIIRSPRINENLGLGNVAGIYGVGTQINFKQDSYDEDDVLTLRWKMGDGKIFEIKNYDYTLKHEPSNLYSDLGDVSYKYSKFGLYSIVLSATEQDRKIGNIQYDEDFTRVLILDEGINPIADISKPEKNSKFTGPAVDFDASGSFVIDCKLKNNFDNEDTKNQWCSGSLENGYIQVSKTINGIEQDMCCKVIHKPFLSNGYNTKENNYEIKFDWIIIPRAEKVYDNPSLLNCGDVSDSGCYTISGTWDENFDEIVKFQRGFSEYTNYAHQAFLKLSYRDYNQGGSD